VCHRKFVPKTRRFFRYSTSNNVAILKSGSELGHLISLKVLPFDRLFMVSYYCPIITLSVRDIRFQKCRDLENRIKGPKRSLKMSPFDRELMTCYWCSTVTMAWLYLVSFLRYSLSKNIVTLKSRSRENQNQWSWYHSIGYGFLLMFYSNFVLKTRCFF